MTEQTTKSEYNGKGRRGKLTLLKSTTIIFIIMGLGIFVNLLWPVWLMPPLTGLTYLAYAAILLLWIPSLIIFLIRARKKEGRFPRLLFLFIGLIGIPTLIVAVLTIIGNNSHYECHLVNTIQGQVRYSCYQYYPNSRANGDTVYESLFEGSEGSILVRLIKRECIELCVPFT